MKLYFEDWLEKQNIDSESLSLFKESIVCYKAGAYRAVNIDFIYGIFVCSKMENIKFFKARQYS